MAAELSVPYAEHFRNQLRNGATLVVEGKVNGKKRFDINLGTGTVGKDDVMLHISSRIDEKAIVFNSFIQGKWLQKEIRHKHQFHLGDQFEYRIRVGEAEFTIFLNGDEIVNFPFNGPVELVEYLTIEGDVILANVSWKNI